MRGPLTASAMHQESPESYASVPVLGDPALLLPLVWSHLHRAEVRTLLINLNLIPRSDAFSDP